MTSLATIPNPFRSSIVSDPWKSLEADVPTIHQKAFIRCCEAIARMRAKHETTGVLVHGEAGSGKTHLLARLHAHIAQEAKDDGPGALEEAIFISAQLQTSAKSGDICGAVLPLICFGEKTAPFRSLSGWCFINWQKTTWLQVIAPGWNR